MARGYLMVVYASTSSSSIVSRLLSTAATSGAPTTVCAHSFIDVPYERTSFYLISRNKSSLVSTALKLCTEAHELIDFSKFKGTHPTLGTVDHVCVSPLGGSSEDAAALGPELGSSLASAVPGVQVFYYGAACPQQTSLRQIRKDLGYFTSTPSVGVCCVGVVPMVVNFNIRFARGTQDKKLVSRITSALRVPDAVEALTLPWEDQLEIACNLRKAAEYTPQQVLESASRMALELGLEIETSYTTGPGEAELLELLP